MEKSKVLIQFLVIFRQFGDVLSFLYARRLRGYTATAANIYLATWSDTEQILKDPKTKARWYQSCWVLPLGPNFKVVHQQKVRAVVSDYFLYADENGEFEIDFEFDQPIDFLFDCTSAKGKEDRDGIFFVERRINFATVFGRLPRPGFNLITAFTKPELHAIVLLPGLCAFLS